MLTGTLLVEEICAELTNENLLQGARSGQFSTSAGPGERERDGTKTQGRRERIFSVHLLYLYLKGQSHETIYLGNAWDISVYTFRLHYVELPPNL